MKEMFALRPGKPAQIKKQFHNAQAVMKASTLNQNRVNER